MWASHDSSQYITFPFQTLKMLIPINCIYLLVIYVITESQLGWLDTEHKKAKGGLLSN